MIIRRLDVFFRTQLITDQPAFFNSVTNYALAPLQYLVGKNQFQSLEGRTTLVPPKPDTPLPYFDTLCKIVLYIGALFLSLFGTPIGIASRCLSFYCDSFPISIAHSHAYLLQLKPHERTPEEMKSAFAFLQNLKPETRSIILGELSDDLSKEFLEVISNLPKKTSRNLLANLLCRSPDDLKKRYWDQIPTLAPEACGNILKALPSDLSKIYLDRISDHEYSKLVSHLPKKLTAYYREKTQKKALDAYLSEASKSLAMLKKKLKRKKGVEFRNDPLYRFPLCLIGQIEEDPNIVKRADPVLWKKCEALRNSCQTLLPPNDDEMALMETTYTNAYNIVSSAFKYNAIFFNQLKEKLESNLETAEIRHWIEELRSASGYPYLYPFYTHRQVLNSIGQMTTNLEERTKVKLLEAIFSSCLDLLKQTDLEEYANEKPNSDHAAVNALMDAMARLENINELKKLIETQKN